MVPSAGNLFLLLTQELMRGDPRTIDDSGASDSEDDDDKWMPAPSDADPGSLQFINEFLILK